MPAYSLNNTASYAVTLNGNQAITGKKTFEVSSTSAPLVIKANDNLLSTDMIQWVDQRNKRLAWFDSYGSFFLGGGSQGQNPSAYLGVAPDGNYPGMIVRMPSGGTQDPVRVENSAGTTIARIGPLGDIFTSAAIYTRNASNYGAGANLTVSSATERGLVVRGAASQTANLAEFQNSAGTVLVRVAENGSLFAGASYMSGVSGAAGVNAVPTSVGGPGLIVRGIASHTGNLAEFQNSAGTVLAFIASDGGMNVGPVLRVNSQGSDYGAYLQITNTIPGARGIVARGAPGQTANILELQNSTGGIMTRVNNNGDLHLNASIGVGVSPYTFGGRIEVATNADNRGIVVRGASGQTANLAEFQNSAGAVGTGFDNIGRLTFVTQNVTWDLVSVAGSTGRLPVVVGGTVRYIPFYA